MTRRKLIIQMTPLLDMLLIIIFAQYLELDGMDTERSLEADRKVAAIQQEFERSESDREALLVAFDELTRKLTEKLRELESARQEVTRIQDSAENFRVQRDALADLLPEMFSLTDEQILQLIKTRAPENTQRSKEQIERLRDEFKKLGSKKPDAALRHLLTFDEMRKRCDLWQVYVADSGIITLSANRKIYEFEAETPDAFVAEMFQRYKLLPESKGLVILLVSHGDISAGVHEAMTKGLPIATRQMADDSKGRIRFEYGILGYTKDPPIAR